MITNVGRNLIIKYLLNQAPEFASHIAIGVGGNAIGTTSVSEFDPELTKSLEFEVARVPVFSKGVIKEDGVEKIVFKGQLPTNQRYKITEIGLYPSESNLLAEKYDSKILATFTNNEIWLSGSAGATSPIEYLGDIPIVGVGNINMSNYSSKKLYFVDSDSTAFDFIERKDRNEQPRYLSNTILGFGNSASINSNFETTPSSSYIENNTVNIDMGNNLPTDKIKLALSVLSKNIGVDPYTVTNPSNVRIVLQFFNNVPGFPSASVSMSAESTDFDAGRYLVLEKEIAEFNIDDNFSWSNINVIRLYSYVDYSEDFFMCYDGLKLENISTINPLYGLTAAENIRTDDSYPILKKENSISYVEYRLGIASTQGGPIIV